MKTIPFLIPVFLWCGCLAYNVSDELATLKPGSGHSRSAEIHLQQTDLVWQIVLAPVNERSSVFAKLSARDLSVRVKNLSPMRVTIFGIPNRILGQNEEIVVSPKVEGATPHSLPLFSCDARDNIRLEITIQTVIPIKEELQIIGKRADNI